MIGKSHYKIAELVRDKVAEPWHRLLTDFWYAAEVGLEVPDRFMIWHRDPGPPASAGPQPARLVHRYYLDSPANIRGELLQMILLYSEGITSFALDLAADPGLQDQLQDMILYTGAMLHYLTDLCTPIHVGCSLDAQLAEILGKRHHYKIETRVWRRQNRASIVELAPLPTCTLNERWLLEQATVGHLDYMRLPESLQKENEKLLNEISLRALYRSVSVGVAWLNAMAADQQMKAALYDLGNPVVRPR
jgi:hypothetical protein